MNILIQVFQWTYAHISFGNTPKSGISWVSVFLTLVDNASLPKYLDQFTLPQFFILTNTLYCQYFIFNHFSHVVAWVCIILMTNQIEDCLRSGPWEADWDGDLYAGSWLENAPQKREGSRIDIPLKSASAVPMGSSGAGRTFRIVLPWDKEARSSYQYWPIAGMWAVPGEEYDLG